ncbi:MAG: hypothetical protein GY867_05995, partial [bacterium]|nr:hypothetical protein [bacterium]
MQISKTIMNPLALAIAILVLTVSAASAQSIWLSPEPTTGISAEILKPKFESSQSLDPDFVSSVWFLSARLRISPNTHALVELPVSFLDGERENYMYNYYGGPEFW